MYLDNTLGPSHLSEESGFLGKGVRGGLGKEVEENSKIRGRRGT